VFAGGASLEAVEAVCDPDGGLDLDVLDVLTSLVDKSLVWVEEQREGQPRVRLLETIREFGLEQLESSGEAEAIRIRHADLLAASLPD
jgi:predicted ATPase